MKVIVESEVENCGSCPHYQYVGESWGEEIFECVKTGIEVNPNKIDGNCPFIESTFEKLQRK